MIDRTKNIDWESVKKRVLENQRAAEQDFTLFNEAELCAIYDQRARQLASRSLEPADRNARQPALRFKIGGEVYCLRLIEIVEVMSNARCCPIIGADDALYGVMNVRGQICSVIDLASLLGIPDSDGRAGGYVLLVRHSGIEVGLRVSVVERVVLVDPGGRQTAGSDPGAASQYIQAWTTDRVPLLSLDAVFAHPLFHTVPGRFRDSAGNRSEHVNLVNATEAANSSSADHSSTGGLQT